VGILDMWRSVSKQSSVGRTTFRLLPTYKEGGGFYEFFYGPWNVEP